MTTGITTATATGSELLTSRVEKACGIAETKLECTPQAFQMQAEGSINFVNGEITPGAGVRGALRAVALPLNTQGQLLYPQPTEVL